MDIYRHHKVGETVFVSRGIGRYGVVTEVEEDGFVTVKIVTGQTMVLHPFAVRRCRALTEVPK